MRKYLYLDEIFRTINSIFLEQRKNSHGYNDPQYCYSYSYNADSLMEKVHYQQYVQSFGCMKCSEIIHEGFLLDDIHRLCGL